MRDRELDEVIQGSKAFARLQAIVESGFNVSDEAFEEVATLCLVAFRTMRTEARLEVHEQFYMMLFKMLGRLVRSAKLLEQLTAKPTTKPEPT